VIDPIYQAGGPIDAAFAAFGISTIQYAAVTHPHPDHFGGLDTLMNRLGGKLACHRDAADPYLFGLPGTDRIASFSGGETIETTDYQIQVIHSPGHNAAHLCFYIETEGILFSGDTILGHGTSIISPPEGDMADYMQTLAILASLDVRMICPAHGPVIDQGAPERIQWYIAHRRMREERVLAALQQGVSSLSAITRQIYTADDYRMHGAGLLPRAERSVLAHLEKLQKEGLVAKETSTRGTRYYLN
jgi:glyoxylase-like metal-dependent hydrolase (beta-lactamase superfamily II)